MSFTSIKEIIASSVKFQELREKMNPEKLEGKWVSTRTFGLVKKTDYDHPLYSFLRRDNGVPMSYKTQEKEDWEYKEDFFGKRKKERTVKRKRITIIDPTFVEWRDNQNKVAMRMKENDEALDSLARESWF